MITLLVNIDDANIASHVQVFLQPSYVYFIRNVCKLSLLHTPFSVSFVKTDVQMCF